MMWCRATLPVPCATFWSYATGQYSASRSCSPSSPTSIASASPPRRRYIMDDLHLSVLQMSVVFSAFTLSYSLFEIPSGWLGDVKGPRRVLTRIVLWWSAFTMLTSARARISVARRDPLSVRRRRGGRLSRTSRAASRAGFRSASAAAPTACMFLGSRVGGMLSAPIALLIVSRWGWRDQLRPVRCDRPRLGRGLVRVVSRPAGGASGGRMPRSSRGSGRIEATAPRRGRPRREPHAVARAAAQPEPLRDLRDVFRVRLRAVFLLHLAADVPDQAARASRRCASGLFASLPFVLAGIADLAGGWLTDYLCRTRGLRVGRCYLGFAAFLTCAALVFASTLPVPADRQGRAARLRAGVGGPRARRLLGRADRHRARSRRRHHRLHEHARQPRRPHRAARRRHRRGPLGLVDVSVLRDRRRLRRAARSRGWRSIRRN